MKKIVCSVLLVFVLVLICVPVSAEKYYEGSAEGIKKIRIASQKANEKLKANGFLTSEEIEEIWANEQTPDIETKLSEKQQKAIAEEIRKAQDIAAKSSLEFGKSIEDPLEQSLYQDGVSANKVLKATREIAKKYEIKVGDVLFISNYLSMLNLSSK